jgi:HPr kinase/phosphorylase
MLTLHASCVAWGLDAVLITGAAGSGKSNLALALMAYGCQLIADDGTQLTTEQGRLMARCPPALLGMIEARGLGLLNATPLDTATVTLCITMDVTETERLPPNRIVTYLGVSLPLLHKVETGHFAAAVLQYLKQGRRS